MIYKILSRDEWNSAQESGKFIGSSLDLRDGYIHFSAASQLRETVRLHYRGAKKMVVLGVCEESLACHLRWEPSRGGELFPHLYCDLEVNQVLKVYDAPLIEGGFPLLDLLD